MENNKCIDSSFQLFKRLIDSNTISYVTVEGKSMVPIYVPGDKVFIRPILSEDIKSGKIVVFFDGEKLVIHRIVKVNEISVITKGDNSPKNDGEILKETILAVALIKKTKVRNRIKLAVHYFKKNKYKKVREIIKYGFCRF